MLLTIKLLCYVRPVGKKQFMTKSRKKKPQQKPTEQIKTINLALFEVIPESTAGKVNEKHRASRCERTERDFEGEGA